MDLGVFSISLNVKDLAASRDFYASLGFEPVGGKLEENWLIVRNGHAVIGLFQGMFQKNMITFHPQDARAIQKALKAAGVPLIHEADEDGDGPAHLVLEDPDGNPILLDQF